MSELDDMNKDEQNSEKEDSTYSYSYQDMDSASHSGDYHADRDGGAQQDSDAQSSWNQSTQGGADQNNWNQRAQGGSNKSSRKRNGFGRRNRSNDGWHQSYQGAYSYETDDTSRQQERMHRAQNSRRWNQRRPFNHQNGSGGGKRFGINLLKCAAFAVVFGLIAGGIFHAINPSAGGSSAQISSTADGSASSSGSSSGSSDIAAVVENVMPSIVSITAVSQSEYYDLFGEPENYESQASGSGIIVSEDSKYLYIATNHHVIEDAKSLTVVFSNDKDAAGKVKGYNASKDLAVVTVEKSKVDKSTLSTIKKAELGDSSELKVGESCIAIGNALGYGQSVTTGVISALNRKVTSQDSSSNSSYTNTLIQTDAAINPGNSGGALLDTSGKVIGINSAKYSDTSVEGMGFAIPISKAEPVLNKLIAGKGSSSSSQDQAYLGIIGQDVDSSVAQSYGMPSGVYVTKVVNKGAADKAGIQRGDIITKFDGSSVSSISDLKNMVADHNAGDKVKVQYSRSNNGTWESKTVTVTLGKQS